MKQKQEPSYQGTFTSAKRYVLETFAKTESAAMKKRVAQFMVASECPLCHGKRLRLESLSVTFAGMDIADISRIPLKELGKALVPFSNPSKARAAKRALMSIPKKGLSPSESHRIFCQGSMCSWT